VGTLGAENTNNFFFSDSLPFSGDDMFTLILLYITVIV
jgi:hypothetical protein